MTGKLVKEDGIFYVKKDGLKYPLSFKCLEVLAEVESRALINFKKPVVFQIISEDNIRKAIIPEVKVTPLAPQRTYTDAQIEQVHFFVSMLQSAVDFCEEHEIVKQLWTTPYSRALMAETNRELCRITSIPFNHVENANAALDQFQVSSIMIERFFRLSMKMSQMDEQARFKLQCQLDNIFEMNGIREF